MRAHAGKSSTLRHRRVRQSRALYRSSIWAPINFSVEVHSEQSFFMRGKPDISHELHNLKPIFRWKKFRVSLWTWKQCCLSWYGASRSRARSIVHFAFNNLPRWTWASGIFRWPVIVRISEKSGITQPRYYDITQVAPSGQKIVARTD